MTQSDQELVHKAQAGSREAMCAIYEQHKDHLLTLARSMVNNRELAEDMVHDVFVSFTRSIHKLNLRGSLKGYLSISICNNARDHYRRKGRQQERLKEPLPPDKTAPSPERHLAHEEAAQKLRVALQQLPLEQREVVLLRTKADMPFKSIADQQGIQVNAARARYRYGLEKLRTLLAKEVQL